MRVVKIFLGIVFSLVILVGAGLTAAVVFIDPNDYKPEIAAAVQDQTGRELNIGGKIGLTVFPWLGLELNDVSLGNAPGFSEPVFARIGRAELRINIMPLLQKRVEVGTVVLDGMRINLERLENGSSNWDDLSQKSGKPDTPPSGAEETDSGPGNAGVGIAALAVDGVRITNGSLSFQDGTTGNRAALENIGMSVSQIALNTPFAVTVGFDIKNTRPSLAAGVDLSGKATLDPEGATYAFSDMNLTLAGTGDTFPGGRIDLAATGTAKADLNRETLDLTEMTVRAYDLDLTGHVTGTSILSSPTFNGTLDLAEFSPRALLTALGQSVPVTSDPAVLTSARANLAFAATPDAAELTELNLNLDETTFTGSGSVRHFARPAISFTFSGDTIDVDRYLPPGAESTKGSEPDAETSGESKAASKQSAPPAGIPLPMDQLRTLDLKGRLELGKLKINNLNLSELLLNITAQNGLITLDPVSTSLYQGDFKGTTVLDVRGKAPAVTITENLTGMQFGPLLRDMTGKDTLTGTTRSSATLTTTGLTPDVMKANLSGTLSFGFENGSIKGINIPKMLRDAVTRVKGGSPDPGEVNETDFSSLTGTATITKGTVDNRDLLMMSPLMRVGGAGQVDLPGEQIDYLLRTTVVKTLKGQQGEPLSELVGLTVPIRITGSFADPNFGLDMAALLKESAVQKGVEELEKKMGEDLKKRIPEGLEPGKLLKGLF
ncbi:MAG TPA: AsmA family protein [Desulfomicrobiaceae bacterium]|nr:AsmA family protein [Desulfomicrobiaceae bacterium]